LRCSRLAIRLRNKQFVAAGMNPMDLKRGIDKAVITASRTFFLDPVSRKRTPNRRKGHHRLLRRFD
jgi:chaperonin GroEL (HSP60 family)